MRHGAWRIVRVTVAGQALALRERIECAPGQRIDDLELVLGTNIGVVAGRVLTRRDMEPVVSARVELPRRDDQRFFAMPQRTDRSGSFFFHSIPAGPYVLDVARSTTAEVEDGSRREVNVEPNSVVHVDLVLPEEQRDTR